VTSVARKTLASGRRERAGNVVPGATGVGTSETLTVADLIDLITQVAVSQCRKCGQWRGGEGYFAPVIAFAVHVKGHCGHVEVITLERALEWKRQEILMDRIVTLVRECGAPDGGEILQRIRFDTPDLQIVCGIHRALNTLCADGRLVKADWRYILPGAPLPDPEPLIPVPEQAANAILKILSDRCVWHREELFEKISEQIYCSASSKEKAINALSNQRRIKRPRSGAFCLFDVVLRPQDRLAGRAAKIWKLLSDGQSWSTDRLLSEIQACKPKATKQGVRAALRELARAGLIIR
jgi:hypothetical protein